MPELPEVEGFRRYLSRHAEGRRIERVRAEPEIVRNAAPRALGRALVGNRIGPPQRHGKWLACPMGDATLLLHFGMTGSLVWSGDESERHRHDRMLLSLEGGELRYRDMRKLGGVWLARPGQELEEVTGPLGPDAYRLDRGELVKLLSGKRGGIKSALMDQRTVAGLGNLLVDEILWRAGIHPRRAIPELREDDLSRIEETTKEVLRLSIGGGGVAPDGPWLMERRDRRDAACPRCGSPLDRVTVGGRTSVFCPGCQAP